MFNTKKTPAYQDDVIGDIDNIPVSELRALYQYWLAKKGQRFMPSRSDISPAEIVELLPKVALLDVERDPMRFRMRLLGTEVVQALGKEVTGEYVDAIGNCSELTCQVMQVVRRKTGVYISSQFDWVNRGFQKYHGVFLPLGDAAGNVNMILCGLQPYFLKEYTPLR